MGRSLVPGFPSQLHWVNATPPSAVGLRGWLTAVAFVNIGSAWSVQLLQDLQQLRARHAGRLRVFAIHVPRFDHERDARRMLKRANRHGVNVPLALDADWVAWQQWGAQAWPSVFLIDGEGETLARLEGGDALGALDKRLQALAGTPTLDDDGIQVRKVREPAMALQFPTGLAVTAQY